MAKIILNVELAKSNVVKNLKELEAGIQGIGKSLGDVKVNKNLTAQLNALTRQYNALAKAAKEAQKVDNKQSIEKQKLAKATAQASTAKINEQKATIQLQTAQVRLTKAQESGAKVVKKATEENEKHRQSILSMAQGFFQWQMAATLVMKPLQMVRQAWASINETLVKTEDAVISLQRVLNDDSLSDSTISGKLYDLAQRYGQTFENVNDIAQNFARTGMSWNETIQATESALLALNVAELDATQASDGMIAIMQQFGYEASELTGIIDILNKTADKFPVTTDKLLTALQRTGSSAKNAKLDLAETVGIITALSKATGRSGENLGTAINSLIQYSSKSSSLDIFASLDETTNAVVEKYRKGGATILEVWQAVSEVINNMDSRQEDILAGLVNSEDIQNLEQELQDELGDIFENINDVYGTANTFRKNYFIALLGNMQTVNDAIETASDASGYSAKENEKYLDTYTAKVNELNAKWQELANNEQGFLGFKKGLVDMGIWGLEALDWMGGLRTASISLFGVILSFLPAIHLKLKEIGITMNSTMGWITLATSLLSIGVGVYQNIQQEQEEQRRQTIANYEANKKTAKSLEDLYDKYKTLSKEDEEYKTLQEDIVNILKEKYPILKTLKEGTEEYTTAIENLTNAELKYYRAERANAATAAEEILKKANIGNNTFWTANFGGSYLSYLGEGGDIVSEILKNNGNIGYANTDRGELLYDAEDLKTYKASTVGENLTVYELLNQAMDALQKAYDEAILAGDTERAETILNSKGWKNFYTGITESKGVVDKYFETNTAKFLDDYLLVNKIETEDDYNAMVKSIIEQFGVSSFYDDTIKGFIGGVGEYIEDIGTSTEETVDTTKTWEEQSSTVLENYKEILDYVNKIRDAEKEAKDLEEKRLAIEEKRKAVAERELELEKAKKELEDVKNNKNVYVYNAAKGGFERVANEKAVAKAEENVKNAEENILKANEDVEKAKESYEEAIWDDIESDLKEGNKTASEIFEKVKGIADDFPDLANLIREALIAQGFNVPEFDKGGVLSGLGGIKATTSDEIVLGPDIARKILEPSSNAQFSAFVQDLGILFGASSKMLDYKKDILTNNNSSNDNRSYTVNGVPITQQQAEQYTFAELIEHIANMPN